MRIKELNVIEFGGLAGRRFELSEGINIFEGDNEAGKSTLWLFIKFMLYGMPKKGHPERERSINRMTHRAIGTMLVSHEGEEYRIERSFSENARGKVVTTRLSDGEKVFEGEEPGEALLCVPREIFENSVAIGQGSCAGLGGEKGAAAIRNILSSADESVDVEKIQKKLGALRVTYRHINGKGGRLYEMSQRRNSLEERLSEAVSSRLKIRETEEKLLKNDKNIEKSERELEAARGLVDNLGRREIIGRFDLLTKNEGELTSLIEERDALVQKSSRGGYIPVAVDGAALIGAADGYDNAVRQMNASDRVLEGLSAKGLGGEELLLADMGERIESEGGVQSLMGTSGSAKTKKTLGVILCGVGIAAFALILVNPIVGIAVGAVLAVIGALLTLGGIKQGRSGVLGQIPKGENIKTYVDRCVEAYGKKQSYQRELSDAEDKRRDSQRLLDYFGGELKRSMERVRSTAPVTVENARAEARAIEDFVRAYNFLGSNIENLRATIERDRTFLSAYNEAELRQSVAEAQIPDISMREAEEKQRYYKESLVVLRDRGATLKTELINLKARGEDPEALGDELEALKKEYSEAERVYEAVLTAIEGIECAAASLRGNITPSIGKNATELISALTDGKYSEVDVGRDLDLTLVDGDRLSTTSVMMSGGMRDAAYLALRISLMRSLFDGEAPPIIMDETLCQLDGGRTERALRMLGKISEDGPQILLFTCHSREGEICSRLGIAANMIYMSDNCD